MMKALIGYSMRSGSTLLQHVLGQHSRLRAYSDLSSLPILMRLASGVTRLDDICVKPLDVFFNTNASFTWLQKRFDKLIWIARDPRDSYLSSVETTIAYTFWRKGKKVEEIDTALLYRWKRIYQRYFEHQDDWYLVRYESLVASPEETIHGILDHLELPQEQLLPFPKPSILHGGDFKVCQTNDVHQKSSGRHRESLNDRQFQVFDEIVGKEARSLGYFTDSKAG